MPAVRGALSPESTVGQIGVFMCVLGGRRTRSGVTPISRKNTLRCLDAFGSRISICSAWGIDCSPRVAVVGTEGLRDG